MPVADSGVQLPVVALPAAEESWTDALIVKNTFLEPRESRCNSGSSRSSSGPARSTSGASGKSGEQPVLAGPAGHGPPRPPRPDARRRSCSRDPQSRVSGQAAHAHMIWGAPELGDKHSNESSQLEEGLHDITFERSDAASSKVTTSNVASGGMSQEVPEGMSQEVLEESEQQPVSDDEARVLTSGFKLHSLGQCRPCFWIHSKNGCMSGNSCQFCHLPHEDKIQSRPCKHKRARAKRRAGQLAAELGDPDELNMAAERMVSQSGYLKSVMQSKARTMAAALEPNKDMAKKPSGEKIVVAL